MKIDPLRERMWGQFAPEELRTPGDVGKAWLDLQASPQFDRYFARHISLVDMQKAMLQWLIDEVQTHGLFVNEDDMPGFIWPLMRETTRHLAALASEDIGRKVIPAIGKPVRAYLPNDITLYSHVVEFRDENGQWIVHHPGEGGTSCLPHPAGHFIFHGTEDGESPYPDFRTSTLLHISPEALITEAYQLIQDINVDSQYTKDWCAPTTFLATEIRAFIASKYKEMQPERIQIVSLLTSEDRQPTLKDGPIEYVVTQVKGKIEMFPIKVSLDDYGIVQISDRLVE